MRYILILFLTLSGQLAFCQISISGKITDNKNKPLPGVSIILKDTYDGATTDSSGQYSFTTIEKGVHILSFSISGYKEDSKEIVLEDFPLVFNISLKEKITELKAVVISAGSFIASDQKKKQLFLHWILPQQPMQMQI